MPRSLQNILYIVILVIVAIVLYMLSPKHDKTLHYAFLPAQPHEHMQAISPSNVKLIRTVPAHATIVGTIRTMQHFASEKPAVLDALQRNAIKHAMEVAAKHGANGLHITELGYTPKQGPLDGVVLYGQAVKLTTP